MKTIDEYAEQFRAEYPSRYAVAFGQLEVAADAGEDLAEQLRRLRKAMNLVEHREAAPERQRAVGCQGCGATVVFPATQDPRTVWCIGCRT